MYIKYELYRAKNQELFNAEMIEWVLQEDKDLIEIDKRMRDVLAQHISNLPEIQKYGTAYIGRMKIAGIEINNNDYLGGLTEEEFRKYMANPEVMPYLDIKWNKTEEEVFDENNEGSEHSSGEENSESIGG